MELGKHYGGEHNEQRVVTRVAGSVVHYYYPVSLEEDSCSLEEFQAWKDVA